MLLTPPKTLPLPSVSRTPLAESWLLCYGGRVNWTQKLIKVRAGWNDLWRLAAVSAVLGCACVISGQTNFTPQVVSSWRPPGTTLAVVASAPYAYVVWGAGLADIRTGGVQILDVSNPAAPVLAANFTNGFQVFGLDLAGHYAYLVQGETLVLNQGRLTVVDLSEPTAPTVAGTFKLGINPQDVLVDGHLAYVAANGLRVLDISNPAQIRLVGTLATGQPAYSVDLAGHYAYLANGDAGLKVIDVTDPAHPVLTATLNTGSTVYSVQVAGNLAYVADGSLEIVDISNPLQPAIVGSNGTADVAGDVQLAGPWAYVADGAASLEIVNVSNPAQPTTVTNVPTGGDANTVCLDGSYLYVADGTGGMVVVQVVPVFRFSPPVRAAGSLTLSWNGGTGARLQQTASLASPLWQDVPPAVGQTGLTLPATNAAGYFRLVWP